jgi:predicted nucleic acid-binding protein
MPLLDSSIRLAQRDLCAVRWTAAILEEAQRNLIRHRDDEERIRRRFSALRAHFDDWEIAGYEDLIPAMTCDEKDRHVLAAAVRGGANQIVTANIRDFPQTALEPYDLEVVTPDDFLLNLLHLYPKQTLEVIQEQAAALRHPPLNVDDVLSTLARCGAPRFAEELATIIAATS